MDDLTEILVRSLVAFLFLIAIGPMVGKQLISQMSYHQFIAAITLGSIAGNTVFNLKVPFGYFLFAMVVFTLITLGFSYIQLKSRRARGWVAGSATVLVENGRPLEENMKRSFVTLDDLHQGIRKKGIFDLNEVEYAVLETDGSISVRKKERYRSVILADLRDRGAGD